jgi:hypothetical protein
MDLYATFADSVRAVFGHLADPSRLGDWLPDVSAAGPGPSGGTGADFPLTVHVDGVEVAASGEVTAFEPPWLVGYRLFIGSRTRGLRVTCAAQDGGTRVHVHQPDCADPLTIDLAKLTRALGAAAGLPGQPSRDPRGDEEPCSPERQEDTGPAAAGGPPPRCFRPTP